MSDINPFPQSAVVGGSLSGHVTIATESLEKAEKKVADFFVNLANPTKPPSLVLGIRGRYGSGKTHLAHQILDAVASQGKPKSIPCISIYAKADRPDLFSIYAELLVSKLRDADFRLLTAGFYRKVLKERSEAARSNTRIPEEQSLSERAQLAVEKFTKDDPDYILRLAEKNLLPSANPFGQVREELRETDPSLLEDFVNAYSAIVAGPAPDAVKWIKGHPLTTQESESLSLNIQRLEARHARDALKFLLTAYRRAGIVVVFCLDELERIVEKESSSAKDETDAGKAAAVRPALKDLAETFQDSGQLLLLSGTDQAWDVFRDDVFHRVTWDNIINVQMQRDEARSLLKAHVEAQKLSIRDVFEDEAIDLLFDVSGLVPRHVIQVAHHSYAVSRGRQITAEDVRRGTALALGDRERTHNAKRAVERVASEFNLTSQYVETKGESPAVFLGDPGNPSIVVHLMRSLFKVEEVKDARNIASQAVELASRNPQVRTCTVVVGYSTEAVRSALSNSVDRVFVYDEDRFAVEFRDFVGWAQRQVSVSPKSVDRGEYSRLERTALEQESQVERVLQAHADRRVERVAEHAAVQTSRRMLVVLAELARQLRSEELVWLDRFGLPPRDTLHRALLCLDQQRDLAREAEYLNRGLREASKFVESLDHYRGQLIEAEEGWKAALGPNSPDIVQSASSDVERSYPRRRNAHQRMETVEVNRERSTVLMLLRGWPLWKQALSALSVAGVFLYVILVFNAWQKQGTAVDIFAKNIRFTRDEVTILLDRVLPAGETAGAPPDAQQGPAPSSAQEGAASSSTQVDVSPLRTRSQFMNAADDFQIAQPALFPQVATLVDKVNDDLRGTDLYLSTARTRLESALANLRLLQAELTRLPKWRSLLDPDTAFALIPLVLLMYVIAVLDAVRRMRARNASLIRVD